MTFTAKPWQFFDQKISHRFVLFLFVASNIKLSREKLDIKDMAIRIAHEMKLLASTFKSFPMNSLSRLLYTLSLLH